MGKIAIEYSKNIYIYVCVCVYVKEKGKEEKKRKKKKEIYKNAEEVGLKLVAVTIHWNL